MRGRPRASDAGVGIQSGNFSGPVGGTAGSSRIGTGSPYARQQETFWGWTPEGGSIELRARGVVTPRSMVAFWMVGLEDRPERSAEICVAEIFGNAVEPGGSAAVGVGLHQFRDPAVAEDFEAVRLPIDVAELHTYAVDWTRRAGRLPRRRGAGAPLRAAADVPDADDAGGLRLPRAGGRRRR